MTCSIIDFGPPGSSRSTRQLTLPVRHSPANRQRELLGGPCQSKLGNLAYSVYNPSAPHPIGGSPMGSAENSGRITMSRLVASSLMGWLLVALVPAAAQTTDADPPTRHVPAKPASRQELDHLEAVKLYGRGVALEHQNRLIEAMRTFEQARRLDPDSAAIHRALVPLYFAL